MQVKFGARSPQPNAAVSQVQVYSVWISSNKLIETHSVVAVGSGGSTSGPLSTMGPSVGQAPKPVLPSSAFGPDPGENLPAHKASIPYPNLNISASTMTAFATSFPKLRSAPVNPGYQQAHQYWDDMRKFFAGKAYSNNANAEVVVVKVRMMTHAPNKKNPACVSVCEGRAEYLISFLIIRV
jgi:hypothetical protein